MKSIASFALFTVVALASIPVALASLMLLGCLVGKVVSIALGM